MVTHYRTRIQAILQHLTGLYPSISQTLPLPVVSACDGTVICLYMFKAHIEHAIFASMPSFISVYMTASGTSCILSMRSHGMHIFLSNCF